MAVDTKTTAFWYVTPCIFGDILYIQCFTPEDTGRWFIRNLSTKQSYTASHTVLK
jgi:hypothetical protein